MKLIVGLGNPGTKYEETKHNVGFKVIDELSNRFHLPLKKSKFRALMENGVIKGQKIILMKPLTYMNLSGEAIAPVMNYFDIPPSDLLVIYDEMDLPVGKIRLRYKGSAGGHNGVKSIIQHIGTEQFNRIRIGIDKPKLGISTVDHVLSTFRPSDRKIIEEMIQISADACEMWLQSPFIDVMNKYNQSS
ncbi:aminoacyl-tRNA hydrolase [Fervidibacillus halotolerans]|uniref:Peptidyl-tRNA hydrolase n=1 Tax=Fervidibacillus halotolerans TaxID=2980027 RepID=A0A9E8RYM3_9BACI|nr:aminoacyl-tRNA hydrolase [Fervidibacillus halotolerans]WAA12344.1 aminoacyl-tRNA hydrolase [Fervidibacillus halotolerans]